ncbi:MAG: L-ribulose-5-phosphate 3-epimerase [Selenomonas ruminantium]|uniref:L-ribulose-5-phosphate 3-epimerase n=1 Tax=Selenomonas ruminantium TaxID=971 RepID=A0A927WI81_SELRU|nr:L-ribulose-5-phosphate 3-epimerase [Selenomonas ruminantium]MBE6085236.1 L-ribulose-5-phosphate 3-epimerase [Selenomonas ruminantium]
MSKYQLGLYEKAMPGNLSWQEKLQAAKDAGFDYVEMSIDETDAKLARLDMSEEQREEIRQAMRETGVPFRSICLSGHRKYPLGCPDMDKQKRSLSIMEKAVKLAADLGIRTIQLAGYDVYYEEGSEKTRADFAKNLQLATDMAAKEGIMLGFETMETPFMDNVQKAMEYVKKIDSPYLGVYPDSGNITNAALLYNDDVAADLKRGKGHIVAVHLKETVPGKYREIPFGTGHVDFEQVIKTSWELGVRRYVAEFWYLDGQDYKAELKKASEFMRSRLDKMN